MSHLLTTKFKTHISDQILESITEPANTSYYMFVSKHREYEDGDETIPEVYDSVKETQLDIYEDAIFGKKINDGDVIKMAPRIDWAANTVYDRYDHTSNTLYQSSFYACVNAGATYFVYKVLDNNKGGRSTVQPTDTAENACNFITTADGYRWKLMYKLPSSTFEKFATADYMPVVTSANVAGNTVSGRLDVIKVTNAGSGYVSVLTGQLQSDDIRDNISAISGNNTTYRLNVSASANNNFYYGCAMYLSSGAGAGQQKTILAYDAANRVVVLDSPYTTAPDTTSSYLITPSVLVVGDGSNAIAHAIVSSNATVNGYIDKVIVVNGGQNYSIATATVFGNTVGVANLAAVVPIIPPKGGHGSDAPVELGAHYLGISTTFANNEGGYVSTENDYRSVGIIKDPLFQYVNFTLDDEQGVFAGTEKVYQIDYRPLTGSITTNSISGTIAGVETTFTTGLKAGDAVLIYDTTNLTYALRTVSSVTNNTLLTLTTNTGFAAVTGKIAHVSILASAVRSGNSTPYLTTTNTEPKFVVGKRIIGESSGAWANVTAISINDKSYNSWNYFNNLVRISYSSKNGTMPEDSKVLEKVSGVTVANGYYHSSNSTHVFLTRTAGKFIASPLYTIEQANGAAQFIVSTSLNGPDLVKDSGDVIYIENMEPITRSNTQSEKIRVVLNF